PRSFEMQMLYGMADPIKEALVSLGQRVRVYTPYGQLLPGMAYLVRRLLENTANESFLRASFTEHVPEEQLLMNPLKRSVARSPLSAAQDHNGQGPSQAFRSEPVTDFSRDDARRALLQALDDVGKQLGRRYPSIVDNRALESRATIDSVNPSHMTQIVGRCGRATPPQAEQAI